MLFDILKNFGQFVDRNFDNWFAAQNSRGKILSGCEAHPRKNLGKKHMRKKRPKLAQILA